MKYCDQCGEKIAENAKFCAACGTRVAAEKEAIVSVRGDVPIEQNGNAAHIDLTEYLKWCVRLERNVYIEEQLINKLKKKIAALGHPNHYDQPRVPRHAEFSFESGDGSVFGFGATVGGVIGLFAGGWLAGALIGGCGLVGILWTTRAIETSSYNKEADAAYSRNMKNYHAEVDADKKRVEQEMAKQARLLEIVRVAENKKRKYKIH